MRRLAAGDLIRVLPGEVFPADGTVTDGRDPRRRGAADRRIHAAAAAQGEAVIAGSHNLTGMVLVRVERTGAQTRYAGIVALMEQASMDKPRLAQIADRIASPFLLRGHAGRGAARRAGGGRRTRRMRWAWRSRC